MSQVVKDFLNVVPDPIIAGGFAMAHHGFVRATVDVDVIAIGPISAFIKKFESLGYKHEALRLPIGSLDLLTKGNKGIDFLSLDNELFCKSIAERAVQGTFAGTTVRYVSLEDLILLKMLAVQGRTGRYDQGDLDALLNLPYDRDYVEQWQTSLGLPTSAHP